MRGGEPTLCDALDLTANDGNEAVVDANDADNVALVVDAADDDAVAAPPNGFLCLLTTVEPPTLLVVVDVEAEVEFAVLVDEALAFSGCEDDDAAVDGM